jgi:hypothetical protein
VDGQDLLLYSLDKYMMRKKPTTKIKEYSTRLQAFLLLMNNAYKS